MNKLTAAVLLPLRFGWAMLASGVQTVAAIVRRGLAIGTAPAATLVLNGFAPMSPQAGAQLVCKIFLAPGETVIDIDLVRREMVLHMLDANNAAAEVDAIRRDFNPPLLAWFGESA